MAPTKPKILAIGPPQGALDIWNSLCTDFDVHLVHRGPRARVLDEIKRECADNGPFQGAMMLFSNGSYGPHNEAIWGPLWQDGNSQVPTWNGRLMGRRRGVRAVRDGVR